jgi:hypothetical protein
LRALSALNDLGQGILDIAQRRHQGSVVVGQGLVLGGGLDFDLLAQPSCIKDGCSQSAHERSDQGAGIRQRGQPGGVQTDGT